MTPVSMCEVSLNSLIMTHVKCEVAVLSNMLVKPASTTLTIFMFRHYTGEVNTLNNIQ